MYIYIYILLAPVGAVRCNTDDVTLSQQLSEWVSYFHMAP